jgi:hypothetical protein
MENGNDYGEWRAVSDTLSVSSNGYVKTHCNNHGLRIYEPKTDNGHGYIVFKHDGKSCRFNRLVCETFHGPPPFPSAVADHRNCNRSDNRAENLHWVTRSENARNVTKVIRRNLKDAQESQDPIPGEEWRMIGRFKISNMGRARVLKNRNKHPEKDASWHPIFTPRPQGKAPYARIGKLQFHVLVAKAFLGAPESPSLTVDHDSQDKSDNRVVNLKWATKKEQVANRTIVKKAACLSTAVKAMDPTTGDWEHFVSYAAAGRQFRERTGKRFDHIGVSRAIRLNRLYHGVRFALA